MRNFVSAASRVIGSETISYIPVIGLPATIYRRMTRQTAASLGYQSATSFAGYLITKFVDSYFI